MIIKKTYVSKNTLIDESAQVVAKAFESPLLIVKAILEERLKPMLDALIPEIWAVIEDPYVDKVYRDSYYGYYAHKSQNYSRNCVRISLFGQEVNEGTFRQNGGIDEGVLSNYFGFIVLRPTLPAIVGRSVISPKAVINNSFSICCSNFPATVDSIKFDIKGFPNSSQDTESISCAETTLWSLMEYFGNKYAEYRPILPTRLIEVLKKVSTERQIPSKGLNVPQMSYALKEFGFGTRVYYKGEYGSDFFSIIGSYVEGGIPIVLALENDGKNLAGEPVRFIGHAVLCIGQEDISNEMIDELQETTIDNENIKSKFTTDQVKIFEYQDVKRKFIYIDDNQPPYQKAYLESPTLHYPSAEWHNCNVKALIVPLYPKIYLEAYEAKSYALTMLSYGPHPLPPNSEVVLRSYLSSNRSYKNGLALSDMDIDVKNILLEFSLPKFVWVIEISTKELIKQKKANGLMILDATEATTMSYAPLVGLIHSGQLISFDPSTNGLVKNPLPLNDFTIFENNLTKL